MTEHGSAEHVLAATAGIRTVAKRERELAQALLETVEQLEILGRCYRFTEGDKEVNETIIRQARAALLGSE